MSFNGRSLAGVRILDLGREPIDVTPLGNSGGVVSVMLVSTHNGGVVEVELRGTVMQFRMIGEAMLAVAEGTKTGRLR